MAKPVENESRRARSTCLIVALALVVIAAIFGYRGSMTVAAGLAVMGGLLIFVGLAAPPAAAAFHSAWMWFAFKLGWINSRILLTLLYFLVFVPYKLMSRLFRRDPLNIRNKPATTYWQRREDGKPDPAGFERLF